MGNKNSRNHQHGLELYSQIESIILDYLSGDGEKNEQIILDCIREKFSTPWKGNMETTVRSMIILRLQQVNSLSEIKSLNDRVTLVTNQLLLATTELDEIYARKGVLEVSNNGNIVSVNDLMLEIYGYSREELIGKNMNIMSSGMHSEEFWSNFYETIRSRKVWEGEIINKGKDGAIIAFSTLVIPKIDGTGFRVIRRDITKTKTNATTLAAIQNHKIDALTNLPTYKQMYIDFADHLPKRVSVIHLNALGDINMAYGDLHMDSHVDVGGMVLQKIAKLLKKYAIDNQELGIRIYKLTGPDFAITYESPKDQEFFDKIYEKMNTLQLGNFGIILTSGKELTIQPSFSFGVALEGIEIKSFLSNALSALAVSKGQSNSLTIYKVSNNQKILSIEKEEMKNNVKHAFANDGFVLDFQPIVQVPPGRNLKKWIKHLFHKQGKDDLKYETLVRIIDPQDSNKRISPGVFLETIEKMGQNIQLTTRVINLACKFMLNNPGHYSINITANDIYRVGRAKEISEQIGKYGINLSRFTFEILESISEITKVAEDNIKIFINHGARISIDDYGTGFGSLEKMRILEKLRISDDHFLKLDMSLVRGIDTNRANMAYVRFAIQTAHKMKAEVIAEGVETEAEREVLRRLGTDYIQGYLTGRPAPNIMLHI